MALQSKGPFLQRLTADTDELHNGYH
jgi:hypothetical protein